MPFVVWLLLVWSVVSLALGGLLALASVSRRRRHGGYLPRRAYMVTRSVGTSDDPTNGQSWLTRWIRPGARSTTTADSSLTPAPGEAWAEWEWPQVPVSRSSATAPIAFGNRAAGDLGRPRLGLAGSGDNPPVYYVNPYLNPKDAA